MKKAHNATTGTSLEKNFHQENEYEPIQQSWILILCDFGQCTNGATAFCRKCHAPICSEHLEKHKQSCGMPDNFKYRFEQEILDEKEWIDPAEGLSGNEC